MIFSFPKLPRYRAPRPLPGSQTYSENLWQSWERRADVVVETRPKPQVDIERELAQVAIMESLQ